jgi:ribosome-associated protein
MIHGMTPFPLRGQYVALHQAVKVVGLADTGGQAKHLVRSGAIRVNGEVATQPGKKLVAGDRFSSADGQEWIVQE